MNRMRSHAGAWERGIDVAGVFGLLVARLSGAMDGGGQSVHGCIYSGLATSRPKTPARTRMADAKRKLLQCLI